MSLRLEHGNARVKRPDEREVAEFAGIDTFDLIWLRRRSTNSPLETSNARTAMLKGITFLYGLPLALSIETATQVLRADVLDRDGLPAHFITKPFTPSAATRQSSTGANNGLYARTCDELWYQRNAILWSVGYCFHEPRAVRVFGNAACGYDRAYEVPLTGQDAQLISLLELTESAKGCAP
jgi:hypothetical protein